jgi:hypothetical protein
MATFKSICDSLNPLVQRRRQNGEHGALFDELIVRIEYYLVHECLGKYVEDEQKRIGFSDILTKVSKDPVWMRDITDRVYFGTEEDIDSFIKAQLGKLPFGLKAHIVFDLFALKGGLTAPTPRSSDRELEDVQAQVQSVLRLMNDETSLDSVKYDAIAALLKQWKSGQISAADYMQKLVQSVESGQTDASIAQKFIRLALLESGHHAPSDSLEMHIQKTDRHRFVLNEVCFATATMRPHKVNDIDTKCGLSVCDKAKSMLKLVMLPKSLCAEASRLGIELDNLGIIHLSSVVRNHGNPVHNILRVTILEHMYAVHVLSVCVTVLLHHALRGIHLRSIWLDLLDVIPVFIDEDIVTSFATSVRTFCQNRIGGELIDHGI